MKKKKTKKTGPFVTYTTEQVFASESVLFIIQIGDSVLEVDGQWFFRQDAAEKHYDRIFKSLKDAFYNGTDRDRKQAKTLLSDFKISPFRMH